MVLSQARKKIEAKITELHDTLKFAEMFIEQLQRAQSKTFQVKYEIVLDEMRPLLWVYQDENNDLEHLIDSLQLRKPPHCSPYVETSLSSLQPIQVENYVLIDLDIFQKEWVVGASRPYADPENQSWQIETKMKERIKWLIQYFKSAEL